MAEELAGNIVFNQGGIIQIAVKQKIAREKGLGAHF